MHRIILLILALLSLGTLSCRLLYTDIAGAVEKDLTDNPEQGVPLEDNKILFIMMDGVQPNLFQEMIDKGELPNIKKYIYDRAAVAKPALTTVPSVTYANMTAMTSGRHPGHTGIPGMYWIDRKTLENRDYPRYVDVFKGNEDARCPLIFDYLEDEYTVAIFWPIFRNADRYVRMFYNSLRAVVMDQWYLHDMECTWNVPKIFASAKKAGRYPRFVLLYLISPDPIGHKHGPDSEAYRKNLRFQDFNLGVMFRRLEEMGLLDKMLITLLSDHGFIPHKKELDFNLIEAMERDFGMKVQFGPVDNRLEMRQRIDRYNYYHAIVASSGYRYAFIYLNNETPNRLRSKNLFEKPVPYERIRNFPVAEGINRDLIPTLVGYRAVHCAMVRKSPNGIAVFGKNGESLIERRLADGKKVYRYSITKGQDPLKYDKDEKTMKLLDGGFHGEREWLEASAGAEYPAVIVSSMELFDEPDRLGDIVLFAENDCELINGQKGGHGGLHRDEMVVPLMLAGPGIKKCEFGPIRSIDLMPTLMEYLGRKIGKENSFDGISFLHKISADR